MANVKLKNTAFNQLIKKACKGTIVSTKDLHRDLYNSGYRNFKELNLELEDLKAIVSDIAVTKKYPLYTPMQAVQKIWTKPTFNLTNFKCNENEE